MQHAIARSPNLNLMHRFPTRNVYVTNTNTTGYRHTYEPVRRTRWGPLLWTTMHTLGRFLKEVTDPGQRVRLTHDVSGLVDLLIRTIPCPSCRNHATHYKRAHPIPSALTNESAFEDWVYTFHNDVNRRIQHVMIGREQANKLYLHTDPLKTLNEYLQSINAKTRHGVNEGTIRDRANTIINTIQTLSQE
jgi:hypothetical protein